MTESKIGILQGRLTPAGQLQAFPTKDWEKEFTVASEVGFDTFEWLLDGMTDDRNPLWFKKDRKRICHLSEHNNLHVSSLCADYIQQFPLSVQNKDIRKRRVERLRKVIKCASEIGVECILIPCFEDALLPGTSFEDVLILVLQSLCDTTHEYGMKLGLEMNWRIENQLALVNRIAHPDVGIYYDLGNATARGYDIVVEIKTLEKSLVGVHIKDRLLNGNSVLLGEGDVDFENALPELQKLGFIGPFVFETPRGEDPVTTARYHLTYFRKLLKKHLVEEEG